MIRLRHIAPLLLLLAAAPAPRPMRPALWKLADKDTTIWLFGTIHVLPAGYAWRGQAIDLAIKGADSLTLELVLDKDPERLGRLMLAMGRGKGLPPLAERVAPGKRAELGALVKESGYAPAALDGLKTWAAAMVLTTVALRRIDVGAGDGVEAQLTQAFRTAAKPVDGLETAEQQLGLFDAMPEAAQRGFLQSTLDSPDRTRAEFRRLISAWSKGNARALERAFRSDPEFTPELRDALIARRDRAWADQLARRLERPGVQFVAVGAGHLVGPDSVQRMLAARGLKVTRVQ